MTKPASSIKEGHFGWAAPPSEVADPGREALHEICTGSYFLQEAQAFRQVMCSTLYGLEQKMNAFAGLFLILCNVPVRDPQVDAVNRAWDSISAEWSMRQPFEVMRDLKKK